MKLENENICSICLEEIQLYPITKLNCSHYFHLNCINLWKEKKNICPICRKQIIIPKEKKHKSKLDDKEVASGKLDSIKDNVLYIGEIDGNTKQKYKLYIWVTSEVSEKDIYEYRLEFNTIKSGGPGF